MKNLILAMACILSMGLCAQQGFEKNKVFVRVYDLQGKKIGKGTIHSISGTAIRLTWNDASKNTPVGSIGMIRTKRSPGHNLAVGALVGATPMALLGVATADPGGYIVGYSAGQGAAAGAVLGGGIGLIVGGITILFKNSVAYAIDGDPVKWKAFREQLHD